MNPYEGDSRILMSDSLRDSLKESNPFQDEPQVEKYVIIALDRVVGTQSSSIVGSLSSILFDSHIELEMQVTVDDAMIVIKSLNSENYVKEIQLHHDVEVVTVTGPYVIDAARLQDFKPALKSCVLALKLSNYNAAQPI